VKLGFKVILGRLFFDESWTLQVPDAVKTSRVIICGTARDVERKLDQFVSVSQRSFQDFAQVTYLVCESFSKDGTWEKLHSLSERIANFNIIQDISKVSSEDFRTVRIASARSSIQDFISARRNEFDYVVMMDLDGTNRSLTRHAVLSCWNHFGWDVVTANQPFKYYDLWALRASGWIQWDVWEEFADRFPKEKSDKNITKHLSNYYRSIPRNTPPILVDSAFGGLGIYKTEVFLKGKYCGVNDFGQEICEHVKFHESIRREGHLIYIIPSLVNFAPFAHFLYILKQMFLKEISLIKRFF